MKETAYTGTRVLTSTQNHSSPVKREKHHETANQTTKCDRFLVLFTETDGYVHSLFLSETPFSMHSKSALTTAYAGLLFK